MWHYGMKIQYIYLPLHSMCSEIAHTTAVKHQPWNYISFTWSLIIPPVQTPASPVPEQRNNLTWEVTTLDHINTFEMVLISALNLFFRTGINTKLFASGLCPICIPQPALFLILPSINILITQRLMPWHSAVPQELKGNVPFNTLFLYFNPVISLANNNKNTFSPTYSKFHVSNSLFHSSSRYQPPAQSPWM